MRKFYTLLPLLFVSLLTFSEKVEVKYDKNHDFSIYKTYSVDEGEIFTPKGERKFDEQDVKTWIRNSITREMELKGLTRVDSAADLHIDFVAGAMQQSEFEDWGPLGYSQSPDPIGQGSSRTWSSQYSQGSLFLDIVDIKENKIVWSSTCTLGVEEGVDIQKLISEIVMKSLKKLSTKPKKKK